MNIIYIIFVEIGTVIGIICSTILGLLFLSSILLNEPNDSAVYASLLYLAIEVTITAFNLATIKNDDNRMQKLQNYKDICGWDIFRVIVNWLILYYYFYCTCYQFVNSDSGLISFLTLGIGGFIIKFIIGLILAALCVVSGTYMSPNVLDGEWRSDKVIKYILYQVAILFAIMLVMNFKVLLNLESIIQPLLELRPK